jgi:hypothetical protein
MHFTAPAMLSSSSTLEVRVVSSVSMLLNLIFRLRGNKQNNSEMYRTNVRINNGKQEEKNWGT